MYYFHIPYFFARRFHVVLQQTERLEDASQRAPIACYAPLLCDTLSHINCTKARADFHVFSTRMRLLEYFHDYLPQAIFNPFLIESNWTPPHHRALYLQRNRLFVCAPLCNWLSSNVGILIGSLLRASCDSNFNLLPEQTVFKLEYCELTAMATSITSVSKSWGKKVKLGHFTLLFCRGRQRNVQRFLRQMHSYCFAHLTFCLVASLVDVVFVVGGFLQF